MEKTRSMATSPDPRIGMELPEIETATTNRLRPAIQPFAGRIGGNQEHLLDAADPRNAEVLKRVPDAAPLVPWRQSIDLRGLLDVNLWRFAAIEAIGLGQLLSPKQYC
jgi:hypothetical protein